MKWQGVLLAVLFQIASCSEGKPPEDPFVVKSSLTKLDIQVVDKFPNVNHPQIAYWFITPDLLENVKYLKDLERVAADSPFDLLFLTARDGTDFFDHKTMHPVFEKLVKRAHDLGLKIGLQLSPDGSKEKPLEENDGLVSEKEMVLDAMGKAKCTMETYNVRGAEPVKSELLKAYAFRRTKEGFYDPETLHDITSQCKSVSESPERVSIGIVLGATFSGYRVYLMAIHYRNYGNLFSDYYVRSYNSILEKYADIPFDGTGLDEFSHMGIKTPGNLYHGEFRERRYCIPFSKMFLKKYGKPLEEELFQMRHAPEGNEAVRIAAINRYMEEMRKATRRIEQAFRDRSRALFGDSIFSGLHNTFHRGTDELWHTGRNWWNLPRQYGQTDELATKSVQLGMMYSYPKNILYNMFYHQSADVILQKAAADLHFNVRTHYHALNDKNGRWGFSLEKPEFLNRVNPLEMRARLLNRFNPAPPKTDLLIVFGFEAMTNWYPDTTYRDAYDMNDEHTQIIQKAAAVWNSGYLNALVPADAIVDGKLGLDEKNHPVYNGHVFQSMVFLYPQYSKEPTIRFLEKFAESGGKLMIEGPAKYDYHGNDVSSRFQAIYEKATVNAFSMDRVEELGIPKNDIPNGCRMEDGSIVMSDLVSIEKNTPEAFSLMMDGDRYEGAYTGVLAILANKKEGLLKLACGNFKELKKNGSVILELKKPADMYLEKQKKQYKLWILVQ